MVKMVSLVLPESQDDRDHLEEMGFPGRKVPAEMWAQQDHQDSLDPEDQEVHQVTLGQLDQREIRECQGVRDLKDREE